MKYLKEITIIFGITMVGEVLNTVLPFPVPAGVYGLFILLGLLCSGIVRVSDVSATGDFLLDMMPLMFVPAAVSLIDRVEELKAVLIPLAVISVVSTLVVMAITGKTTDLVLRCRKKGEN